MARILITNNDTSPLVLIITWFLCIISVLSVLGRGATKILFVRPLESDDYSIFLSLVLSIAQSVAVTVQTSNGLGKRDTALSPNQLLAYSKARYAGNMLYTSSVCLSELSVILLVKNLMPFRQDKQVLLGVGSIIVVWSITGIIVYAVECGSPTPWDYFNGHCIDRSVWLNCIEVMNILINVVLIALPLWIVSKVQLSLLKKVSVGLMFAFRFTVCIASICKLVYWKRLPDTHDLTVEIWPVTLCTQVIQCMSIASFCILYLKPLFRILDSGFMRSDEFRRRGQLIPEGPQHVSTMGPRKPSRQEGKEMARLAGTEEKDASITILEKDAGWDCGSHTSDENIMKETRTFTSQSSTAD